MRGSNSLISFDWVRFNASAKLTRDEDTTPAALWITARRFRGWRIGWNEGRSVSSKNDAELSEIIVEINDL
jgi:hypothetical protein